ncbi:DUF3823 domain-containing protein [Bacteroides sp.]|uniref:DUF3823 domain-containing protein n=1 Tax=Bacteroides sp. TaxID=29523 RepID=UPI0026154EEA|nr:DUF3823 domain-containing protein [Bacteroides sp.]
MKKIVYFLAVSFMVLAETSCQKFDNYDEPQETLRGTIIDKETKAPFFTETGNNGVRIKLMEYSWSDNPTPYYFTVKQDGTFNNTKIFKGDYNIEPEGAFVPLVLRNAKGEIISDASITMGVKGTVNLNFEVEPFLRVEYVGEPVIDGRKITVKARITRGTANPDYQQEISDVYLFINGSSPYVGSNNFDDRYDKHLGGEEIKNIIGETITLTTEGELPAGRTYYLRVGARINKDIAGAKRYNYADVKTVSIP